MPISPIHLPATLPICPTCWVSADVPWLHVYRMSHVWYILFHSSVFSCYCEIHLKKKMLLMQHRRDCTIIPDIREEGNKSQPYFMLLKNTWINPNISSKLNCRSGIEEETWSWFIPCKLEIRVNYSLLVTPGTDMEPALGWHLAMFNPARPEAAIPLAEGIWVLIHLPVAGALVTAVLHKNHCKCFIN